MAEEDAREDREGGETPLLEWISAGVGLLVTLAILGFIGWQAWSDAGAGPPAIIVRAEGSQPAGGGWVVEFVAENLSPTTAAAVEVEGVLRQGGRILATSRATLDHVPGLSERTGGLFFEQDPRAHELGLRALGYATP